MRRIHPDHAERIREAIDRLAEDPRPHPQSKQLAGREGRRLRVGNYRVLYEVDDEEREVRILEVWPRQQDYRS
ncbi:MAG: type II toxin-antitoxin system RelE/ParE family toxin [Rubrobacteraceae bacterium]|nr:type II toxin-antitoxin system RelE/ParE family toxin [Rubrobacteraceae bacterium]MCL6439413.1 type II toxin-antitoxin system RelE/ParE family toxin [Rubrobacteraceae bacterium]